MSKTTIVLVMLVVIALFLGGIGIAVFLASQKAGVQGLQGLKGEKGLKGDTGNQGSKGDTGPQGETGPQGIPGQKGGAGATGSVPLPTTIPYAEVLAPAWQRIKLLVLLGSCTVSCTPPVELITVTTLPIAQ